MKSSNQVRVLHIMSTYGGGISSFIKNKADALKDSNIRFDVLTFDDVSESFKLAIEQMNGRVITISNPKKDGFKVFFQQVNKVMTDLPKDTMIHSHVNGFIALPFYLIAKKRGLKRFVIHAHTASPMYTSNFLEFIRKRLNQLMSKERLSCGVKASENIFGKGSVANSSIVHVPNSINADEFLNQVDVESLKKEILNVQDDRLIIGSVGRFRKVKNHYFMIDIIEHLKKLNVDFIWFFAGDGLLLEEIQKRVNEKHLENHVVFLGRRDDIANLFKIMDLFVLPSFNEGLPTVVIEAQATSTYSIISDTITKECDLKLGLVKFLSISQADIWANEISTFNSMKVSKEEILSALEENKFTNKKSAELYKMLLERKIVNYRI